MKKELLNTKNKAFSLFEVLLAIGLLSLFTLAIVGGVIYGRESTMIAGQSSRAALFCNEGLEAVRNIRDAGWENLVDGNYGLSSSGGIFSFLGSEDASDIFTRQINISTFDANTKNITSTITWPQTLQRSGIMACSTRYTNWRAAAAPPCPWSNPAQESFLDLATNTAANKVQVQGNYAYIVKQGNNSQNFFIVNIANPAVPVLAGQMNLNGRPNNLYVSGNYAYVSSNDNAQELQIINVTNPAVPVLAGSLNLSGNADATSVWYNGTGYVYLTRVQNTSAEFYIVNVINPAMPTLSGSLELGTDINDVVSWGNYAYLASNDNSRELLIVNVANPAAPVLTATLDLVGNENGISIAGFPSIIVLGRSAGDFSTINVTNPAAPALLDSINTGQDVNDIAINFYTGNALAFIATSNNNADFQVVNIANPADLTVCTTYNVNHDLRGIAYHPELNKVLIVGDDNPDELIIMMPGQ